MKTLRRFSIAPLFFLFALLSLSCDSSIDLGPDFGDVGCLGCGEGWEINTINEANHELTSHTWKMTNINISGSNPDLYNYKLVFNANNSLIATFDNISYNGTWSITDDNPNQQLISDLKLNLNFSSSTIFNSLSKKWTFNSFTLNLFNEDQGDQIEFVYLSNGIVTGSFRLLEIK